MSLALSECHHVLNRIDEPGAREGNHRRVAGSTVNRPYNGAIVPARHYGLDLRVESVMIEINRRLYLEPDSHRLAHTAHHTGARIQACLNQAVAQWASSHDG